MKGRPVTDGDLIQVLKEHLRDFPSMKGRPVKDGDWG